MEAKPKTRRRWFKLITAAAIFGGVTCTAAIIGLFVLPRESLAGKAVWDLALSARNHLVVNPPWKGPNIEWAEASPEEVGLDKTKLDSLTRELSGRGTAAFLLVKDNRIVQEWYRSGRGPNTRFSIASLAKALVGSVALMATLDARAIELDDPASRYLPAWAEDPLKSQIRILDLATHSAGIEDVYFGGGVEPDSGWQGRYYQNPERRFEMAITEAPTEFAPGARYSYSGVGYYALAYAIGAALRDAKLPDIRTLLRERVMRPLDVPDDEWSISYGRSYEVEGMQLYAIGSGAGYTARAAARVGQLMLARGEWEGTQLLSAESVRLATGPHPTPSPDRSSGEPVPTPSLGWWLNADRLWPSVPSDAYVGLGAGHQILLVIPSLELVAVRFGGTLGKTHWGDGFWSELERFFLTPLMNAITAS